MCIYLYVKLTRIYHGQFEEDDIKGGTGSLEGWSGIFDGGNQKRMLKGGEESIYDYLRSNNENHVVFYNRGLGVKVSPHTS